MDTDEHESCRGRAIASRTSQVLEDRLNLDARRTEVGHQTELLSDCPQVVDALRAMRTIERPDGFQFDENGVLDEQVGKVFSEHGSLISDGHSALLFAGKPRFAQFQRQRIFINLFRKSLPRVFATVNVQPMIRSEIAFRSGLSVFICVHPCSSVLSLSSYPACPQKLAKRLMTRKPRGARERAPGRRRRSGARFLHGFRL